MYRTESKAKHDLVTAGRATPIDYKNEDVVKRVLQLTGDGVDAVFDGVGGKSFQNSFKLLRPDGTLVAFGFMNANRSIKRVLEIVFDIID